MSGSAYEGLWRGGGRVRLAERVASESTRTYPEKKGRPTSRSQWAGARSPEGDTTSNCNRRVAIHRMQASSIARMC